MSSSPPPKPSVPARKKWGLFAMFAALAVIPPILMFGTEAGAAAWAWTIFFGLIAVLLLFDPDMFTGPAPPKQKP